MRRALALCLPIVLAGCQIELPVTGRPCEADADCDADVEEHYCQLHEEPLVCLPGTRIPPPDNRRPLMARGVIVAGVDETIEGQLVAIDPDGDPVEFDDSEPYTAGTIGVLTVARDGSFTFVSSATPPPNEIETAVFDVRFSDGEAEMTGPLFAAVVDDTAASELTIWGGAASSSWPDAANWVPDVEAPTESHSVLLVGDVPNLPSIADTAPVRRAFATAAADLQAGTLEVRGEQLFSASPGHATGTVFSLTGEAPQLAGEVSTLTVADGASLLGATYASADVTLGGGAGSAPLDIGRATLWAAGDVAEQDGVRLRLDDVDGALIVDGALALDDASALTAGRLFLRGDLTSRARVRLNDQIEISFGGDVEQSIRLAESAASWLWSAVEEEGATIRFEAGARFRGDLDVRGHLVVDEGVVVLVEGTLFVRSLASWPDDGQGDVYAVTCRIAPNLRLPDHIHCQEEFPALSDAGQAGDGGGGADGGPGSDGGMTVDAGDDDAGDAGGAGDGGAGGDAGSFADGGLDAGLDAGPDAGNDGGFDAGSDAGIDAGFDAGIDAGIDAGTDGGYDAGIDGGYDAGFDGGFDAGFDAGFDGGYDAGFDGGYDGGPPPAQACVAADSRTTRMTHNLIVGETNGAAVAGTLEVDPDEATGFVPMFVETGAGALWLEADGSYLFTPGSLADTAEAAVDVTTASNPEPGCLQLHAVNTNAGSVFIGGTGAFETPGNWAPVGTPGNGTQAYVPAGSLVTVTNPSTVGTLYVEDGATVSLGADPGQPILYATSAVVAGSVQGQGSVGAAGPLGGRVRAVSCVGAVRLVASTTSEAVTSGLGACGVDMESYRWTVSGDVTVNAAGGFTQVVGSALLDVDGSLSVAGAGGVSAGTWRAGGDANIGIATSPGHTTALVSDQTQALLAPTLAGLDLLNGTGAVNLTSSATVAQLNTARPTNPQSGTLTVTLLILEPGFDSAQPANWSIGTCVDNTGGGTDWCNTLGQ
jgi:hypothetical protein